MSIATKWKKPQADARTIVVDTFISPEEIDPIHYDGRTYYLFPESPAAEKPYAVLTEAMEKLHRCGVATVVLHGKEQLLIVRPVNGVLAMIMMRYQSQIRSPTSIKDFRSERKSSAQELKLAQQLIESTTSERFDFSKYEDQYTDRLKELIDAKIAGQEVIVPPQTEEEIPIINLMDALRQSVQKNKQSGKAKQARKALTSRTRGRRPIARQRRRKTS